MTKRMTWGQVKNIVVEDVWLKLGDYLEQEHSYLEVPKNNRLMIADFDKQKLHELLLSDGFGGCWSLAVYGDNAANIFAKIVIDKVLEKLKAMKVNVVDTTLLWRDPVDGILSDEGAIEWLENPDFRDVIVDGFGLVIEGRENRRLCHRFNLKFSVDGTSINQKSVYEDFIDGSAFFDVVVLHHVSSLLRSLCWQLQQFDLDEYYAEHFNLDDENRMFIYQELQEDINDILRRSVAAANRVEGVDLTAARERLFS